MSYSINLKDVERRAYLSYHQDGLLDLCIGLAIAVYGALIWYSADMAVIAGASLCGLFVLYAGAKRAITIPRLGYVEFGPARKSRTRSVIFFTLAAVVLANIVTMFAWIYPSLGVSLEENFMIIAGTAGAALLCIVAYLSNIGRFYIYGGVTLVLFLLGFGQDALPQFIFLLGMFITISGAFLLVRFLGGHPTTGGQGAR